MFVTGVPVSQILSFDVASDKEVRRKVISFRELVPVAHVFDDFLLIGLALTARLVEYVYVELDDILRVGELLV